MEIGEEAPTIPKYKLDQNSGDCSSVDYKKEFSSYFLEEQEKDQTNNLSGERLSKALNCISSTIERNKNLINHENFDKRELINFLNQAFVKTKNMEPTIDHITNPDYFDDYIFIKDNIIYMIGEQKAGCFVKADKVYHSQNDAIIFSKQEVDVFVGFLKNLSDFFLKLEQSSYEVFERFFNKNDLDAHLLSKSQLNQSKAFQNQFISFLSNYFHKDFPEYSRFFDKNFSEIHYDFNKLQQRIDGYHSTRFQRRINKYHFAKFQQKKNDYQSLKLRNSILQPLAIMAQLPPSFSDKLTVQNIKYIMLNIYIMRALFSVYDINQDSILSPKELKSLSCLITPLVSIIISPELKNEWKSVQNFYAPNAITNYIITHQEIPSRWNLNYIWYRVFKRS